MTPVHGRRLSEPGGGRPAHPTTLIKEHTMTERPYTNAELRAEAARQHATLIEDPDYMGVGEQMQDQEVTPGGGVTWGDFSEATADAARRRIHDLINGAVDVSAWAIALGADGLEPTAHTIDLDDADGPFVRLHLAIHPDMPEPDRVRLHEGVRAAIATALGATDDEDEDVDEQDSDSDVFDLIADIASRLRDATDSGEYHAVGLIYDLANGRTTVAEARADLAGITFRHV